MKRVIICENMRSLHNVGAVFRTADAAGWDGICLSGYTGTPPDRRIEKVSLGAEATIDWWHEPDTTKAIADVKEKGFTLIALEQTVDSVDLLTTAFKQEKIALILGNEVEGVLPDSLALVDVVAEIPMHGEKHSLNVSVACGIALYAIGGVQ